MADESKEKRIFHASNGDDYDLDAVLKDYDLNKSGYTQWAIYLDTNSPFKKKKDQSSVTKEELEKAYNDVIAAASGNLISSWDGDSTFSIDPFSDREIDWNDTAHRHALRLYGKVLRKNNPIAKPETVAWRSNNIGTLDFNNIIPSYSEYSWYGTDSKQSRGELAKVVDAAIKAQDSTDKVTIYDSSPYVDKEAYKQNLINFKTALLQDNTDLESLKDLWLKLGGNNDKFNKWFGIKPPVEDPIETLINALVAKGVDYNKAKETILLRQLQERDSAIREANDYVRLAREDEEYRKQLFNWKLKYKNPLYFTASPMISTKGHEGAHKRRLKEILADETLHNEFNQYFADLMNAFDKGVITKDLNKWFTNDTEHKGGTIGSWWSAYLNLKLSDPKQADKFIPINDDEFIIKGTINRLDGSAIKYNKKTGTYTKYYISPDAPVLENYLKAKWKEDYQKSGANDERMRLWLLATSAKHGGKLLQINILRKGNIIKHRPGGGTKHPFEDDVNAEYETYQKLQQDRLKKMQKLNPTVPKKVLERDNKKGTDRTWYEKARQYGSAAEGAGAVLSFVPPPLLGPTVGTLGLVATTAADFADPMVSSQEAWTKFLTGTGMIISGPLGKAFNATSKVGRFITHLPAAAGIGFGGHHLLKNGIKWKDLAFWNDDELTPAERRRVASNREALAGLGFGLKHGLTHAALYNYGKGNVRAGNFFRGLSNPVVYTTSKISPKVGPKALNEFRELGTVRFPEGTTEKFARHRFSDSPRLDGTVLDFDISDLTYNNMRTRAALLLKQMSSKNNPVSPEDVLKTMKKVWADSDGLTNDDLKNAAFLEFIKGSSKDVPNNLFGNRVYTQSQISAMRKVYNSDGFDDLSPVQKLEQLNNAISPNISIPIGNPVYNRIQTDNRLMGLHNNESYTLSKITGNNSSELLLFRLYLDEQSKLRRAFYPKWYYEYYMRDPAEKPDNSFNLFRQNITNIKVLNNKQGGKLESLKMLRQGGEINFTLPVMAQSGTKLVFNPNDGKDDYESSYILWDKDRYLNYIDKDGNLKRKIRESYAPDSIASGNGLYDPEADGDIVEANPDNNWFYDILLKNPVVAGFWAKDYRDNHKSTTHGQKWFDKKGNFLFDVFKNDKSYGENKDKFIFGDGVNAEGHDVYRGKVAFVTVDGKRKYVPYGEYEGYTLSKDPAAEPRRTLVDEFELIKNPTDDLNGEKPEGEKPESENPENKKPQGGSQTVDASQIETNPNDTEPLSHWIQPYKYNEYLADALDLSGLMHSLWTNNRIAQIAKTKVPVLSSPKIGFKSIYGDFAALLHYNKQAADVLSKARRLADGTANTEAGFATWLDAQRIANLLKETGHKVDNDMIRKDMAESDAIRRNTYDYNHDKGDVNLASLTAQINYAKDIEQGRLNANFTSLNNYRMGLVGNLRHRFLDWQQMAGKLYLLRMLLWAKNQINNDPEYRKRLDAYEKDPNDDKNLTSLINYQRERLALLLPYINRQYMNLYAGKYTDDNDFKFIPYVPAKYEVKTSNKPKSEKRGGRIVVDSSRMKYRADDLRELRKLIRTNIRASLHALDNVSRATLLELKKMMGI